MIVTIKGKAISTHEVNAYTHSKTLISGSKKKKEKKKQDLDGLNE
jgi:hypothetical protein